MASVATHPAVAPGSPSKHILCAVAVTYNPDGGFPERVGRIRDQVGGVVVVDNGSEPAAREMVEKACSGFGFGAIMNPGNLGVAAALNQGIAWARERSFAWALALDQDSVPEPDLVESLIRTYEEYPLREKVAVIGSNYRDESRRKSFLPYEEGGLPAWVEQTTVITSGSLLSLAAMERVGPFREEFFIDHVDDEYCLRAHSAGCRVILCRKPVVRHPIGTATAARVLGKEIWTSNHRPVRRYYMARNFTVLVREYLASRPGWILHRAARHVGFFLLMILLEDMRREKVSCTVRGVGDAFRGRMGRFRPEDGRRP